MCAGLTNVGCSRAGSGSSQRRETHKILVLQLDSRMRSACVDSGAFVLGVGWMEPRVDRTPSHETFFSTLSSLCTHHIVAQGVARRVCIKHDHPHVITCQSVCCSLVLSSSSVSRASTFSLTSTCLLFYIPTPMMSRTPSIKPNAHPKIEE